MMKSTVNPAFALALALALAAADTATAGLAVPFQTARRSVVKIHVTKQEDDYSLPWQGGRMMNGTGTGFIIGRRRILTNAHIVSNARFIQIQKDGDPRRYDAAVRFAGHDCDLATLEVADPSFFEGTTSLELAGALPRLSDTVTVLGYPMGGDRLSLTRGVVSRIDYSVYSHSGVDHHLVLQVDAAINPGNSGGPVLFRGRVVGLAFQGLAWAENIGYAIPVPVIRRFLDDIADGAYHGYQELGAATLELRNAALRRALGLPDSRSGVAVHYLDPFGCGAGRLEEGDVLLAIDGHDIADDGTIRLDGNGVLFAELLERKQWGEAIDLKVWRKGSAQSVSVPLTGPADPFGYRRIYDERPPYAILAGLVFAPLSRNYLETIKSSTSETNARRLLYFLTYAKIDGLCEGRDEFVVLTRRLPHPVNTYSESFLYGVVGTVNGTRVRNLREFNGALASPAGGFHVIRFEGMEDELIIGAEAAAAAAPRIMEAYAVPAPAYLGE